MNIPRIRKFVYENIFWLRAVLLAFLFGYISSLFIETSRPFGLFLSGATVVIATALFIAYFQQWKTHRYHNGGDIICYLVICGFWAVLSVGRYADLVFPDVFNLITKQTIHFLWYSVVLAIFLVDHIVFRSWKTVDYWVGELIKDAQVHLVSRESNDKQTAIDSTQRILHELYAIKYKDSKLKALVPLLEHDNYGVRAWAARFLLEYGDNEKRELEVFEDLAKKEGYVGEAAQKVLTQWSEEKARRAAQDTLYETTPLFPQ